MSLEICQLVHSNMIRKSSEKEFIADLRSMHSPLQSVRYKLILGGINATGSCNKCKIYPFICRLDEKGEEYLCTYISKQVGGNDVPFRYFIDKIELFISLIYASKLRTNYVRETE